MKYYHNLQRTEKMDYTEYEFPIVKGDNIVPTKLIAFDTKHQEDFEGACHFFMHDYKLERIWSRPDKYLNYLQKFEAVIMPDFSMYEDAPVPVALYNKYRNHWLANYFQEEGIPVIINPQWMSRLHTEQAVDGLEASVICKSSVGCVQRNMSRQIYNEGFYEMLDIIQPETILHYGLIPEDLDLTGYNVLQFDDHATINRRNWDG